MGPWCSCQTLDPPAQGRWGRREWSAVWCSCQTWIHRHRAGGEDGSGRRCGVVVKPASTGTGPVGKSVGRRQRRVVVKPGSTGSGPVAGRLPQDIAELRALIKHVRHRGLRKQLGLDDQPNPEPRFSEFPQSDAQLVNEVFEHSTLNTQHSTSNYQRTFKFETSFAATLPQSELPSSRIPAAARHRHTVP